MLYAAGHSPDYVMDQMGHDSASMALEVYSKVMPRKPDDGSIDDLVASFGTQSHRGERIDLTVTSE